MITATVIPGAVGAGLPMPKPVSYRNGKSAEYKLMRVRECPFPAAVADTPDKIFDFWKANIETAQWFDTEKECVVAMFLNTRRYLTGFALVSLGTLDTCLIHPREVFRPAIVAGAAAIIMAHNHPSGDPTPSEEDIKVTRDLMRGGQLIKIAVLDHLVIGTATAERPKAWVSLRELGYFYS